MRHLKDLIWDYLCCSYPNANRKRTKFGLVLVSERGSELLHGHRIVETLVDLFGCDYSFAFNIWESFVSSRPLVTTIKNSTNHDVLIFKSNT